MYYIIKSNTKEEPFWYGKGFSNLQAKIYHSFGDVVIALQSYWFNDFVPYRDDREVRIITLTEQKKEKLLKSGKIFFRLSILRFIKKSRRNLCQELFTKIHET